MGIPGYIGVRIDVHFLISGDHSVFFFHSLK
jgi:hypothetical protein